MGSCERCRFCTITPSANHRPPGDMMFAQYSCHRYPRSTRVLKNHWCGEWARRAKAASPAIASLHRLAEQKSRASDGGGS